MQCRYVGLWQTRVLSLDLAAPSGVARLEATKPVIKFLFGDDSNARTQVDVPYNQRSVTRSTVGQRFQEKPFVWHKRHMFAYMCHLNFCSYA